MLFLIACFIVLQTDILTSALPVHQLGQNAVFPGIPEAYSTNIRLNNASGASTIEIREVANLIKGKAVIELWTGGRHVKYIERDDDDVLLTIQYWSDKNPTCNVKPFTKSTTDYDAVDAPVIDFLHKLYKAMGQKKKFSQDNGVVENGIGADKWSAHFDNLDITVMYSAPGWIPYHKPYLLKNEKPQEIVKAEMAISGQEPIVALYSKYDPSTPVNSEFQPPEGVYCEGYRTERLSPALPRFFSYNSEIITYESFVGIAPVVSHRAVYYDHQSGILRIDFQDSLADDGDMFSKVTAQTKSFIHDFNSGLQYTFDGATGECSIDSFSVTFNAISSTIEKNPQMLDPVEFFAMAGAKLTYSGQYPVRGLMADVFAGSITLGKKESIIHWYFSVDRTQLVENEHVEKNVLLKMVVQPVDSDGKEGETEVNFYNFIHEEPKAFVYDLRSCYNDALSKTLVLTFPAKDFLRGGENVLKRHIHYVVVDVTKISKQRVFVQEVTFKDNFLYAEFKLLEAPAAVGKSDSKEPTLAEAFTKLKNVVSEGNLKVSFNFKNKSVELNADPKSLNEFGDEKESKNAPSYREGAVVGLTIGILILGFLLGAVTINLVISRKFGVSLFQKSGINNQSFENPINESSM